MDGENRISRRKALKRIGAGAAIAWSAPVLSSLRTPAFAAGTPRCTDPCAKCFDSNATPCGTDSVRGGTCLCSLTAEGTCVCGADDTCDEWGTCATSSDCPSGFVCKPVGCRLCSTAPGEMNCQRPCGAPLPAGVQAATTGTRMSG